MQGDSLSGLRKFSQALKKGGAHYFMKQNDTNFEPNPKMVKLLEAAVDPEVETNISAWCVKAGVARSQWYRWQKEPGFLEWFNSEFKKSFEGSRAALIKIGLQKALAGDFQYWKVMMERAGEYGPSLDLKRDSGPIVIIDAGKDPYKTEEGKKWVLDEDGVKSKE